MTKGIDEFRQEIDQTLRLLQRSENNQQIHKLVSQGQNLCKRLADYLEQMPEGYHKNRLLKQMLQYLKKIKKYRPKPAQISDQQILQNPNKNQQKKQSLVSLRTSQNYLVFSIVEREIETKDLKLKPEQIQMIQKGLLQNKQVMNTINEIIEKQGGDIEEIQKNLNSVYNNIQTTNKELQQADRLQIQGIIMKIRLGIGSILGLIGAKLFGVFGGIAGFFTGVFGGSVLK